MLLTGSLTLAHRGLEPLRTLSARSIARTARLGIALLAASAACALPASAKPVPAFSLYAASGTSGQTVNLRTLMLSGGLAVLGRTVQFSVDSTPVGSSVSDASGASLAYTIPGAMALGPHNVTVAFAGDDTYAAASRSTAALTVVAPKANVAFSLYAASGSAGQTANLRTLMLSGGVAVIGRTVQFLVDGSPVGSGVSGASGASFAYVISGALSVGMHNVTVSFAGDATYAAATRTTAALTVKPGTAITLATASATLGQPAILHGTLLSGSTAVVGRTLAFSVDGVSVGSGVTDTSGVAQATYKLPLTLGTGSHNVTASFAGDSTYGSATTTAAKLTAVGLTTAFSLYAASGTPGLTTNLRVLMYGGGAPLPGKTVAFSVDGVAAGTGVTDAKGIASYSYFVPGGTTNGLHNVTATFDASADTLYAGTSRTTPALTVTRLVNGPISFATAVTYHVPDAGDVVMAADLDNDGNMDVIIGGSTELGVLYGKADGTLEDYQTLLTWSSGAHVRAVDDFTGDGLKDIVFFDSIGRLVFLKNLGARTFDDPIFQTVGTTVVDVKSLKMNGDANLDLVLALQSASPGGSTKVYYGNGDGTFTLGPTFGEGSYVEGLAIGDMNSDGYRDFAVSFETSTVGQSGVALRFGTSIGGIANGPLIGGNTGAETSPLLMDLKVHNKLDLAWCNYSDGTVTVMFGAGDGTFGTRNAYPGPGGNPIMARAANLNGDLAPDLVVAGAGSSKVGVYRNYGSGLFADPIILDTGGSDVRSLALADFNHDGKLDIVTQNSGSSSISVLINTTP